MILKTAPAVFVVGETYQIMTLVTKPTVMWVEIGGKSYFDDSNGILRSSTSVHRVIVPQKALNEAGAYTLCYREVIDRKPYFSELAPVVKEEFSFRSPVGEKLNAYHIADTHNLVDEPIQAAKFFEQEFGSLDFLIMNGDIPNHSGDLSYFDAIYEIAAGITGGNIPIVFARGNHDTRGFYAENMADYTPSNNGKSYYSFRLGNLWGLVLDCGEDKPDSHEEYGGTICCEHFRRQETAFLEVVASSDAHKAADITRKLIICHVPFNEKRIPPFDIEEELYAHWAKLLNEKIKPDLMGGGHTHHFGIYPPNQNEQFMGLEFPLVVASEHYRVGETEHHFHGGGFIFEKDKTTVVFNSTTEIFKKALL